MYNQMWCWYCKMREWNHQMYKKNEGTTEYDKNTVTCDVGTAQYEDGTVECEKK